MSYLCSGLKRRFSTLNSTATGLLQASPRWLQFVTHLLTILSTLCTHVYIYNCCSDRTYDWTIDGLTCGKTRELCFVHWQCPCSKFQEFSVCSVPANNAIMRIKGGVSLLFREALASVGFTEIVSPKILSGQSEGGSDVFHTSYFGSV